MKEINSIFHCEDAPHNEIRRENPQKKKRRRVRLKDLKDQKLNNSKFHEISAR